MLVRDWCQYVEVLTLGSVVDDCVITVLMTLCWCVDVLMC
jgi:hypothetical protein